MRVDWHRGSDADHTVTQFFIPVYKVKFLCLEKPSALQPFASRATN